MCIGTPPTTGWGTMYPADMTAAGRVYSTTLHYVDTCHTD